MKFYNQRIDRDELKLTHRSFPPFWRGGAAAAETFLQYTSL